MRSWRRPAALLAALAGLIATMLIVLLLLIDGGLLDRRVGRWISADLGRQVRFAALHSHLLSRQPTVEIDGLRIANPAWLPAGDVATIGRLVMRVRLAGLLRGRWEMTALTIDRPVLRLIRIGPGRNNWTLSRTPQAGPAFAPLASVRQLRVTAGRLTFRDRARDLSVTGPFTIGGNNDDGAFRFGGAGLLRGAAIAVSASGGLLHGDAVGKPYPFVARIVDGATTLVARGTSKEPFNLTRYRLAIAARGPNLADLGYLFNLITPNSAPYTLTTLARSDGRHLRFDTLAVRTGRSEATGTIWSDHGGPRRDILANFHARRLDRADIDAMLSPVPPRAIARAQSGAVPALAPSRWLLSDAPLGLQRIRASDLDFRIAVDTLTGYALPLTRIATRIDLDHGRLDVPAFRAALYSGIVSGRARIDARAPTPRLSTSLRFDDLHLAQIGTGNSASGILSGRLALSGTGTSLHRAAATATGQASLRVTDAAIAPAANWIVAGDLLRAAGSAVAGAKAAVPVRCAVADLSGTDGRLAIDRLTVATRDGTASGAGAIDLGAETLAIVLTGTPAHRRLFQVTTPVRLAGPWLKPAITMLPGRKAAKLGLHGALGVALTPLAGLLPIAGAAPVAPPCR